MSYYMALYDAYSKALKEACEVIVGITGTCPVDYHDLGRDCSDKCKPDIDYAVCWMEYLLGEWEDE